MMWAYQESPPEAGAPPAQNLNLCISGRKRNRTSDLVIISDAL